MPRHDDSTRDFIKSGSGYLQDLINQGLICLDRTVLIFFRRKIHVSLHQIITLIY